MNEQKILRWGVLGTAGIAKNRTIPGMLLSAKSELYAIAGRNPAKLQAFADEFHPTVTYDNYQALLDERDQALARLMGRKGGGDAHG